MKRTLKQLKSQTLQALSKWRIVIRLTEWNRSVRLAMRRWREAERVELTPEDQAAIRFYAFTSATAKFFHERTGRTDIRMQDTPHFRLAAALVSGPPDEMAAAEEYYKDYLAAAGRGTCAAEHEPDLAGFTRLFRAAQQGTSPAATVVVTRILPDDDWFLVQGTATLAVAWALGRTLRAVRWPYDVAFMTYAPSAEFYGTRHYNRPYQSIYHRQRLVIPGRRTDIAERLKLIPPDVLSGASVLAVASNFGMNGILARQMGASSVLGIEYSARMVDLASRFAMIEGVYPSVQFRTFNIDTDALGDDERFDVGFLFAIYSHLRRPERLLQIAEQHIRRHIVFEGRPGGTFQEYQPFLESGIFESVRELGRLARSVFHPEDRTRMVWLCTKRHE